MHFNGTVEFKAQASGGKLNGALNYAVGAFPNTDCNSVNGCHDSDANDWKNGNLGAGSCEDCHDAGTKGSKDAGKTINQGWWTTNANGTAKHIKHINTSAYVPADRLRRLSRRWRLLRDSGDAGRRFAQERHD